jgi:hypothetical protein
VSGEPERRNVSVSYYFAKLLITKYQISISHARGKIGLYFYSLYRKYYNIVVIRRGDLRACSPKCRKGSVRVFPGR